MMSVAVNLRQLPSHVKQSAYFPSSASSNDSSLSPNGPGNNTRQSGLVPLSFPATNTALWDRTPTGLGTTLHITKERNLHVHVLEKTLRLAYRHTSQHHSSTGKTKAFLLGQALTNPDDDGVTIAVDRFDPGHELPSKPGVTIPTAKLPGDHVIQFTVTINKEFDHTTHTEEGFKHTFELLQHHCSSRDPVDVANLVSLCIHCCCFVNDDDITFSLHIAGVTIATSVELTPISGAAIIPTALARNLMGPLNISEVQGNPKYGFVTLDQTRKLLLLLDSDPKAYTLPLVGIWLSGISYIGSPVIWAACLRYMLNSSIQERVCSGSDGFLLIIYSPNKRKPDFYQCTTTDGALSFQLVGCRENLHVFKHANVTNQAPIQLELRPARDGPNKSVFLEACKQFKPIRWNTYGSKKPSAKRVTIKSHRSDLDEEIHMVPRPSPQPIMDKSPSVRPSVPELSLIYDSFDDDSHQHHNSHRDSHHDSHPRSSPMQPSPQHQPSPDDVFLPYNSHHDSYHDSHHDSHPRSSPMQPSPHYQQSQDDVFQHHTTIKRHLPPQQDHQQKENYPVNHHNSKPSHDNRTPQSMTRPDHNSKPGHDNRTRPGPLRDIDQNSPRGLRQRAPSDSKNSQRNFQPRQQVGRNKTKSSAPSVTHRHHSEARRMDQQRSQKTLVTRQNTTVPPIGQGFENSPVPANQKLSTGLVSGGDHQNQNRTRQRDDDFEEHGNFARNPIPVNHSDRRTSAPLPRPNEPSTLIGPSVHSRQSLPNDRTPNIYQQQQAVHHRQSDAQSRQMAIPPSTQPPLHEIANHSPQSHPVQIIQGSEFSSQKSTVEKKNHGYHGNISVPVTSEPLQVHSVSDSRLSGNSKQSENQNAHSSAVDRLADITEGSLSGGLASHEAVEQLKRQEQMIKELQTQIQMLLQVQAAATALPSGVITPPTTPTSTNHNATSTPSTNQPSADPANHHRATPQRGSPNCGSSPRAVNHHSPPTRMVTTATSPSQPKGAGCSIGVNTGQSLFWSPGSRGGDVTSVTHSEKSSQPRSLQHTHPAARDAGNSTFDLDSEPNMSVNVARDETHSGVSMIGPIEMNSTIDTNGSRTSSPKRTPSRSNNEGTKSPHLSDSFHSPVLGESASTCRPPGRPIISSDDESENEGHGTQATGPSLLYKDQRKFYNNILGNVQQLLEEPVSSTNKQTSPPSSSSSSSSNSTSESSSTDSEDSSDEEEDVAMETAEGAQGLLGLKLSLPEDGDFGSAEKSAVFRSMHNTSPDFFPRINYVSIMDLTLDSPNLSMEANALAMKYLSDEELAKLSIGFKSNTHATPRKEVNPLLRTALMRSEKSMVGVSSVGFRAVDMSMASRKYMEKYGLLEIADGDTGTAATAKSPKKKTRKKKKSKKCTAKHNGAAPSTEAVRETASPGFDVQAETDERIRATPTLHPVSREISPISEAGRGTYEPWLKRPAKKPQAQVENRTKSPEELRKGQVDRGQGGAKSVGNILDISRLQELPKLL